MTKYTMEDISKWAEEYKTCLSFKKVAIKFDICEDMVSKRLHKYKYDFDLIFPFEDDKQLLTEGKIRCSGKCGQIKILNEFYFCANRHSHICKVCAREKQRIYTKDNYDTVMDRNNDYQTRNPEKIKNIKRKSKIKNRDKRNEKERQRKKVDIMYKILCNLRTRISDCIKCGTKKSSVTGELGCSLTELKRYLESKFKSGMTWENYGLFGWHVDHIIPLALFDLTNIGQFKKAVNYTNLQPLWAEENLKKGAKIIEETTDVD